MEADATPWNPRFSIETLLDRIFANEAVASYLVSKAEAPPMALGTDVLTRSYAAHSLATHDREIAAVLLKRSGSNVTSSGDEDSSRSHQDQLVSTQPEVLFFVCHAISKEYCLGTATDLRTPVAFLEKPSSPVPGLRRIVCMKLNNVDTVAEAHAVVSYFWLADGRSSITMLCYGLDPKPFSEKHFVLLDRYPSSRYPKYTDVLETVSGLEQSYCPWCVARHYSNCECARPMVDRMQPSEPNKAFRDGWSMQRWAWGCYELGIRKYAVKLENLKQKKSFVCQSFHQVSCGFQGQSSFKQGFEHYMSEIKPLVTRQLVSDSVLVHSGDQPRQIQWPPNHKYQTLLPPIPETRESDNAVVASDHAPRKRSTSNNRNPTFKKVKISADCVERVNCIDSGEGASNSKLDQPAKPSKPVKSSKLGNPSNADSYFDSIDTMDFGPGEPKTCALCPAQFTRKHDLKRHVRSKHLHQRLYRCERCDMCFTRRNHVAGHMKKIHEQVSSHPPS